MPLGNRETSPKQDSHVHHSGTIDLMDHLGVAEGLNDPAHTGRVISADQHLIPVPSAVRRIGIPEVNHIETGAAQQQHASTASTDHAPGIEHLDLDPMRQRLPDPDRVWTRRAWRWPHQSTHDQGKQEEPDSASHPPARGAPNHRTAARNAIDSGGSVQPWAMA